MITTQEQENKLKNYLVSTVCKLADKDTAKKNINNELDNIESEFALRENGEVSKKHLELLNHLFKKDENFYDYLNENNNLEYIWNIKLNKETKNEIIQCIKDYLINSAPIAWVPSPSLIEYNSNGYNWKNVAAYEYWSKHKKEYKKESWFLKSLLEDYESNDIDNTELKEHWYH